MYKSLITLLLTICLFIGTTGCALTTTGEGSWELYFGIRTRQHSEQPAKVELQSSIADQVVDFLTDYEISEFDLRALLKVVWLGAQWYLFS